MVLQLEWKNVARLLQPTQKISQNNNNNNNNRVPKRTPLKQFLAVILNMRYV